MCERESANQLITKQPVNITHLNEFKKLLTKIWKSNKKPKCYLQQDNNPTYFEQTFCYDSPTQDRTRPKLKDTVHRIQSYSRNINSNLPINLNFSPKKSSYFSWYLFRVTFNVVLYLQLILTSIILPVNLELYLFTMSNI